MHIALSAHPPRTRQKILLQRAFYTTVAVVSSLAITAVMSLAFHHVVRLDFLMTAFACSFVVSLPMTALFQRLNRELADALQRERALLVEQERQRAWRESMTQAQHHVNNLANCLHLVELEQLKNNSVSAATLNVLQEEIQRVGTEMRRLGELGEVGERAQATHTPL